MNNCTVNPVPIGNKLIGDGYPIYIMADVGLTNGGDLQRSFDLIDIAHELGVDAIKFQMIGPDTLLGDKSVEYTYPTLNDGPITENMFEMFSQLSYTPSEWAKLVDYTRLKNIEFICTAHYMGAVPILESLGVSIHKICTWSMTHKRLVQSIGKTGKPLMLDTGAFTIGSLNRTLDWHISAGGKGTIILHDFHTNDVGEMNFRSIPYMKNVYNCPVGYTPQGRDFDMDFMSIGMGVSILEKRLTTDRGIPKNGHIKALEKSEFSDWISRVKKIESALGSFGVFPTKADLDQSKRYFKSLYLKKDACKGEVISDDHIEARRPGTGIPASMIDSVIGRRLKREMRLGTMLDWGDFQ
jgi:sialic acid synthase SpsE